MKKSKPMSFKVEKATMPPANTGGGKRYEWPFEQMKVGECFYYPVQGSPTVINITRARGIVSRAAERYRILGVRVATRYIEDGNKIGVWRVG